jgi:hypothetical protein
MTADHDFICLLPSPGERARNRAEGGDDEDVGGDGHWWLQPNEDNAASEVSGAPVGVAGSGQRGGWWRAGPRAGQTGTESEWKRGRRMSGAARPGEVAVTTQVENRTRVMRAPTRGLAKALRGIYWDGGGGPSLPPARSIRPASGVYKTRQDKFSSGPRSSRRKKKAKGYGRMEHPSWNVSQAC